MSFEHIKLRLEAAEDKVHYLQVLNDFANALLQVNSIEQIAWTITENAISKLGLHDCVVYLREQDRPVLTQRAAYGPKNPKGQIIIDEIIIPIGQGIVGTVAETGRTEIINDTSTDDRYIVDDEIRLSELTVPIIYANKVIGVIDSEHPEKNFFTQYHIEILEAIAAMAANRIENSLLNEKLLKHKNELEELVNERTKSLNRTIRSLSASNTALEQYSHAIAHDLRSPLRTIGSFVSLIKMKEKELSEENQSHIEMVVDNVKRMDELLSGLLQMSELDGIADLQITQIDLNEILYQTKRNLHSQIEENGLEITNDKLPSVLGNKAFLQILFQNLISNSMKFKQESLDPVIHVGAKKIPGSKFDIRFSDNGIGLQEDELQEIFKLFKRSTRTSHLPGSGIGLNLCYKAVNLMGSELKVESKGINEGTTFSFVLTAATQQL